MYGPPAPNQRTRVGLWFAAFTIACLLMLLASGTDAARTLQQVTTRALDPVRSTLTGIGDGVVGLVGIWDASFNNVTGFEVWRLTPVAP